MNKMQCAAVVFLIFVSSLIIEAPLSFANAVVIPEMQKSIEKNPIVQSSAGVVSRVYVRTTNAQS